MKLKNKRTGEIGELHYAPDKEYHFTVATEDPADMMIFKTLAELNNEWEDVPEEPKEYWYIDYDGGILCRESDNSFAEKMMISEGDSVDLQYPKSTTRRGRVGHEVSKTLACADTMGVYHNCRIRKLTPRECFRLMGFDDKDFDKASKVSSNSQLYKQAGNSIVVNVLEYLLNSLLNRKSSIF